MSTGTITDVLDVKQRGGIIMKMKKYKKTGVENT